TEDLCAGDSGRESSLSNSWHHLIVKETSILIMSVKQDLAQMSSFSPSIPALPLPQPSIEEPIQFTNRISEIEPFILPTTEFTKGTYTASDVASKQGSLPFVPPISNLLADKLHAILTKAAAEGKPVLTMGVIDPVQTTQMARFQEVVASAIHFEDQLHGGEKCVHLSGKVLVPTSTHTSRLISARFPLDLHKSIMLTIARTDAESDKRISSTGVRWWRYLRGRRGGKVEGKEVDRLEREWMREHGLVTFGEAVEAAIKEAAGEEFAIADKEDAVKTFKDATAGKSISDMRGCEDYIGYTGVLGLREYCLVPERDTTTCPVALPAIKRATTFAAYADLVWLETKTPDIEEARYFARKIRETYPETRFVYNLSPSFTGLRMGLALISLAGLHSNATATAELAARYKGDGMLAYVQLVQRKENEIGCDVLTHQKW
ncbi:mitochondrial 2-methylisocitrate lyase, partial [Marasmius sp. AFHP31]